MLYDSNIHPFFEEGDDEEAIRYLADKIGRNITNIITNGRCSTGDDTCMDQLPKILKESDDYQQAIRQFIYTTYGVNVVTMANYGIVEDTFMEKYYNHIINYLSYCDVSIEYIEFTPITIVPFICSSYLKNKNVPILPSWEPHNKWYSINYLNNKYMNITSPINRFINLSLIIRNLDKQNIDFINHVYHNDPKYKEIKEKLDNGESISVFVNILPQPSYKKINTLVDAIHKYF